MNRSHIGALRPDRRNARRHTPRNIGMIERSLEADGFGRSILLDSGGNIIAGNGVTEAAGHVGLEDVIVVPSDGTRVIAVQRMDVEPGSERAIRLAIADNRTQELSEFDPVVLAEIAADVDLSDFFIDAELDAIIANAADTTRIRPDDPGADIDRADELNREWRVERGDVWEFGEHRLMCGDCTNTEDLARLLGGDAPVLALVDPPYGMRLDADFSSMKSNLRLHRDKPLAGGHRYDAVVGDGADYDAEPLATLISDITEQLWFGADYYAGSLGDTMHRGSWLVWDKRLDETADRMYGSCFELVWSRARHKRDILRHQWAGIFGLSGEAERARFHPTQKPTALYVDIIVRFSAVGAVVFDPYAGAGGVLVAAQQAGRRALGMEIEPKYCAVVLERMSGMGLTPERA